MIYKPVSLTESQIGKYVDINGDGIPEGVIFADLAIGGDKLWNGTPNTRYRYEKSSKELKEYIVVRTYLHSLNGKQEMLAPILDGEDRFYIMALKYINSKEYYWYMSAFSKKMPDYEETTLEVFGSGKQNTSNMIEKWNSESYGEQNAGLYGLDMGGIIQTQVNDGWFIPSIREWSAFAQNIGITHSNYSYKRLSPWYWSSSQYDEISAWAIDFPANDLLNEGTHTTFSIRLAKTI